MPLMKMLVITFISASGGVGKTMLAINTAAHLAIDGHKVLFIDFDPSATATRILLGRSIEDYNLQTLMKNMIRQRKGKRMDQINIDNYIKIHRIPKTPSHEIRVLPGGNIYEISTDIKNLPEWGRLLRDIVDLIMNTYNYEPTIVIDSPNWVYEFFEMTMYLGGYYIAVTRPGGHEISKFTEFLKSISDIIRGSANTKPEEIITYVVNQYRSNMKPREITEKWGEIKAAIGKGLPNIMPLVNEDAIDCYYGKEKTPFVGFKMRDELSIDNYMTNGPLLIREGRRKDCDERYMPIKQFNAYYSTLKNFLKISVTTE